MTVSMNLPRDYLLKNWGCTFFCQDFSIWICEACWHELCILQKRWFNNRILTIHRAFDPKDHSIKTSVHKEKHETTVKTQAVSSLRQFKHIRWHLHYVLIITTKIKFWSNNRVKQHMLWNLLNQLKSLMNLYYLTSYKTKTACRLAYIICFYQQVLSSIQRAVFWKDLLSGKICIKIRWIFLLALI